MNELAGIMRVVELHGQIILGLEQENQNLRQEIVRLRKQLEGLLPQDSPVYAGNGAERGEGG